VKKNNFDREEYFRYSRQLSLPEIESEGQQKLKGASALIVGVGGLGSSAALYLTAAGVGHIGLVDFDVVELSNLQRQILYSSGDVGKSKVHIAEKRLKDLNPGVQVTSFQEPLTSINATQILERYDIVIDGSDNFPTRYLVNDIAVFLGKPDVYGSIYRFDGQISLFYAKEGPCYRCLYETPPPPQLVPSCAEGGVLGVMPGIVGSMQAAETIKWIAGIGEPLVGRLLLFDALSMTFREIRLSKNQNCVVCGSSPTITEPIDYEEFCGVSGKTETVKVPEIDVFEVKQKIDGGEDVFILDVREQWEWQIAHLDGAHLIPMDSVPSRLEELNPSQKIVVYCHIGIRSATVTEYLIKQGYSHVKNMTGGIKAWTLKINPSLNLY